MGCGCLSLRIHCSQRKGLLLSAGLGLAPGAAFRLAVHGGSLVISGWFFLWHLFRYIFMAQKIFRTLPWDTRLSQVWKANTLDCPGAGEKPFTAVPCPRTTSAAAGLGAGSTAAEVLFLPRTCGISLPPSESVPNCGWQQRHSESNWVCWETGERNCLRLLLRNASHPLPSPLESAPTALGAACGERAVVCVPRTRPT